jgi:hypothetical protein
MAAFFFLIRCRKVDGLAAQAHYHVNSNDLVASRWRRNFASHNL